MKIKKTLINCFKGEVAGYNALTTYVLICMIFIGMAIMYHGLILIILRKSTKIGDSKMYSNGSNNELSNLIIKWDQLIFIIYIIIFALFNVSYFIYYYDNE